MAASSDYLDLGHQKLFRWCSFEFRHLGRDTTLEVSPTMREAVRRLRKHSTLLKYVQGLISSFNCADVPLNFSDALKNLTSVRQATILQAFLDALTRGGPGGLPRPIELHAHDPTRYVGDMLAWVHQAMAGEREFLESLFDVKGDGRMVGSVRPIKETETERWIGMLMDENLDKICTPLKVNPFRLI